MAGFNQTVKATYKEKRIERLSLNIIQMLPVRTVHVHLHLQQLNNIAAVLLQDPELIPQGLAELMSGNTIIDMASQLIQDRCGQLFRRASVGNFCSCDPRDFLITHEDAPVVQFNAVEGIFSTCRTLYFEIHSFFTRHNPRIK
jgi:hypothetical protein